MSINSVLRVIWLQILFASSFTPSPAFACYCRNEVASVKANMHTFQTALEAYAVDHNGTYPQSAELLKNEAVEQNYWKPFKNPYTHTSGHRLSFEDMSKWKKSELYKHESAGYFWGLRVRWQDIEVAEKTKSVTPGLVLYEYIKPTHYRIYGLDGKGSVIKDRDRKFYLSNE